MRIRVLGSGAGGGLPQWNCGGEIAVRARAKDPAVSLRGQDGCWIRPGARAIASSEGNLRPGCPLNARNAQILGFELLPEQ